MTILYYDCFAGISGDMHLGALLDLGVDEKLLRDELAKLPLEGYELVIKKEQRKGISGTRVDVLADPVKDQHHKHHHEQEHHAAHRTFGEIKHMIGSSRLSDAIRQLSIKIFEKVAVAEARIHNKAVDDIHFHEVGAVDSIVDIVGAAICIRALAPDKILASTVELGSGSVVCAHGTYPVPAPATAEILTGIPVRKGTVEFEATTPTGAAILASCVDQFTDAFALKITKTGYGIGHKDGELPNVLRVKYSI